MIQALINSFLLVFAGEMGDKTQLLSLALVTRYGRPWTILAGVFVATLLNHAGAAWGGEWISAQVPVEWQPRILAALFVGFGFWLLIPDKEGEIKTTGYWGVFLTTAVAFFIAEMGDKTQLATVALGAQYSNVLAVTLGTTIGMLAANALAVFVGPSLLKRLPMVWIRRGACLIFILSGLALLRYSF